MTISITKQQFPLVLFDLDGVLTDTASLHAKAWKKMFDNFLLQHAQTHDLPYVEFSIQDDYLPYVDGKPRYEGVSAFLESRRIVLPRGEEDDSPEEESVCGLGNRKNLLVNRFIEEGIDAYPGSLKLIEKLSSAGIDMAVVSSSRNAKAALDSAGIAEKFSFILDGNFAKENKISGKPAPDTYLAAANHFNIDPENTVVFEDAVSGVEAGVAGRFGLVVGVDRGGNREALEAAGADVIIEDLGELVDNVQTGE